MLAVRPDCVLPDCPACVLQAMVASDSFAVATATLTKDGTLVLAGAQPLPGSGPLTADSAILAGVMLASSIRDL